VVQVGRWRRCRLAIARCVPDNAGMSKALPVLLFCLCFVAGWMLANEFGRGEISEKRSQGIERRIPLVTATRGATTDGLAAEREAIRDLAAKVELTAEATAAGILRGLTGSVAARFA
jgi:hypothetical protein